MTPVPDPAKRGQQAGSEVMTLASYVEDKPADWLSQLQAFDLPSYVSYSQRNFETAASCLEGAMVGASHNDSRVTNFHLEALLDIHHFDRAEHGASALNEDTVPIRKKDIPKSLSVSPEAIVEAEQRGYEPRIWTAPPEDAPLPPQPEVLRTPSPIRDFESVRTITALDSWDHTAPLSVIRVLPRVLATEYPDEVLLVKYQLIRQRVYVPSDPVIYARYGEWYVKVAEWE